MIVLLEVQSVSIVLRLCVLAFFLHWLLLSCVLVEWLRGTQHGTERGQAISFLTMNTHYRSFFMHTQFDLLSHASLFRSELKFKNLFGEASKYRHEDISLTTRLWLLTLITQTSKFANFSLLGRLCLE